VQVATSSTHLSHRRTREGGCPAPHATTPCNHQSRPPLLAGCNKLHPSPHRRTHLPHRRTREGGCPAPSRTARGWPRSCRHRHTSRCSADSPSLRPPHERRCSPSREPSARRRCPLATTTGAGTSLVRCLSWFCASREPSARRRCPLATTTGAGTSLVRCLSWFCAVLQHSWFARRLVPVPVRPLSGGAIGCACVASCEGHGV